MTQMDLEKFLLMLDTERARLMLQDLRDDSKRSPQLYNSIEKLLARHNFVLSKVSVDEKQLADMEALNREYDKVLSATEDNDTGYGVQ
ncbi:putative DNA packaging protein small subunit [Escherichia phage vB_EcoP-Ro103C3lw]|uniref:DNA packaging protein small subunit n=1 Tax=Escherichia phage Ro45lw TaxID=2498616 RepID=A0A3S9URY5_9CAUD|nr:terminase small subunit [Escherichia phage Ro45lw]AZS13034.1 putative DNA packaging protein small subunit [Escherichia phage Ro45lw]QDH94157.1 putative DNA packaging protein small subunit [Escherichia phage vB_EcoP-Ro103C3lw]